MIVEFFALGNVDFTLRRASRVITLRRKLFFFVESAREIDFRMNLVVSFATLGSTRWEQICRSIFLRLTLYILG